MHALSRETCMYVYQSKPNYHGDNAWGQCEFTYIHCVKPCKAVVSGVGSAFCILNQDSENSPVEMLAKLVIAL